MRLSAPAYPADEMELAHLRAENLRLRAQMDALSTPPPPTFGLGLKPAQDRILSLLVRRGGVVPKGALMAAAAGRPDRMGSPRVVDVHICHIRSALEAAGLPVSIQTIWGVGYRLHDEGGVL